MQTEATIFNPHERIDLPNYIDIGLMFDALERRDDETLWNAARLAPSQVEFFEQLRNQVGFTKYRIGSGNGNKGRLGRREPLSQLCAMFFVPVIMPARYASLRGNAAGMSPAIKQFVNWLRSWFENKMEISIFNAPVSYEEISIWSPSVMREKLEQLACKKEPTIAMPPDFNFCLPDDAPALAYFVAAAQQPVEYPALPPINPMADMGFTAKVSGAIQVCGDGAEFEAVETLVPNYASEALEEGLKRWLAAIHQKCGIGRWDATPMNQDLVMLQLEVGDSPGHTSPIPLRAHQLGLDAVDRIIAYVDSVGRGLLPSPQ